MKGFSLPFRCRDSRPAPTGNKAQLGVEQLEERTLMTASGPAGAATLTPPGDLQNATLQRVARAEFLQHGGHLTRTDVIHLLAVTDGTQTASVRKGRMHFAPASPHPRATLKPQQLTDLGSLVKDNLRWGLSANVAVLLGHVVNFDPANKRYQGGSLVVSGQLTVGDRDWMLQDLVGKWFYGTDLPALGGYGTHGLPYRFASGCLFGPSGPSADDVAQGGVRDCYFLAALAETALRSPQTIRDMFLDNADGTFTVRFFNQGQADYVTVNRALPVNGLGEFVCANRYQYGQPAGAGNRDNVLWVALAEKAYAQLSEEGWSRDPNNPAGSAGLSCPHLPTDWDRNTYHSLDYGTCTEAFRQITGAPPAGYVPLSGANAQTLLASAFNQGYLVTVLSDSSQAVNSPMVPSHCYYLQACDLQGWYTLGNPYFDGTAGNPQDGLRTVTLSWPELTQYVDDFQLGAPPPAAR
jgi:hypothetical protein